ncbi:MAG: c-type cytochrome [Thermoanaerobaculia bacterium]|nr:c-type cytochrome [Thermoanaerobaculia bacterium]
MTRRVVIAALLFAVVFAAAAPVALRGLLRTWEQNELLRGRELAREMGCDQCHRPYRGVEIPNPGSRWGSVPRFEAGNWMMYGESKREIEEFIRFGAPRSWLEDPQIVARLEAQRIRMPAYDERLDDDEIADLTAWASAVEGVERARGEGVEAGREIARREGCLSCHGLEGAGGLPNPGSLGGFVPGFLGRNFEDLVASRAEFDEWVKTGTVQRLEANPLVSWFWRRQTVSMPAYGETLTDDDLDRLWDWVVALRETYR